MALLDEASATVSSSYSVCLPLSLPIGAVSAVLLYITIPNGFPNHGKSREKRPSFSLAKVDFLGAFMVLSANLLLITSLQVGGSQYPWNSPLIATCLVLSGVFWVFFFLWERYTTRKAKICEPVFSWKFFRNRICMANLL